MYDFQVDIYRRNLMLLYRSFNYKQGYEKK